MADDTEASSGEVPVKLLDAKVERVEEGTLTNGNHQQEKKINKEEDEETALDEEFIKVEKESIDAKDCSLTQKTTVPIEEQPVVMEAKMSSSTLNVELLEAKEKIKVLMLELGSLTEGLQHAESEKSQLRAEVIAANEKLQESDKHHEGLELSVNRLKEENAETEMKYNLQIKSLEETLGAQEVKHKELIGVKEAFDGLSVELESSRKRMEKLELDLLSSANEASKFEELSNERGSHAELESKRALELEKMLELEKLRVKEMAEQMGLLQGELKGLCDKITENQKVEEALNRTMLELSVSQEELEHSKSQVAELEQKVISEESIKQELTQELNLRKVSEEQLREDVLALENLFSASKEDLQAKVANLEEIELKLQEELKMRETIEADLKTQELHALNLQEEMLRVTGEKEALEASRIELNSDILLSKEICGNFEARLNLSDQNFTKTDALLAQALSNNSDLEQKLKSLEEINWELGVVAETAEQKNVKLEDLMQASNAEAAEVKAQMRETELRLISTKERNVELEKQLNLAELKYRDADSEIKDLCEKTLDLSTLLRGLEEESALSKCHFQAYNDRISQLESSLDKSSLRNSGLENELKDLAEKCAEHETQASTTHQRSLELEELIQISHSKAEDSGNKMGELELLLETRNYQMQGLEEQLSVAEVKYKDAEAELQQYTDQVSELSAELEAFQVKSTSLEIALQAANSRESELTDLLNMITEEKKKYEDLSKSSGEKIYEAESLIEILQIELQSVKEKLQNVEKDLEVSGVRENEIMGKLKSAEEQLEQHGQTMEQATARSLELESLHETLAKDSEIKIQEAMLNFSQKDSEAKELHEKLKSVEEKAAMYQDQATEATERVVSLKAELEGSLNELVSLENTIDELKRKVLETETKAEQSISENEMLAETNSRLREALEAHQSKINELHDMVSSVHAEKETTAEQLVSHVKTISELTDQHSRGLELQLAIESRIKETEVQLHEAIERLSQRDSEARYLNEKLQELEAQVKLYEEQVKEAGTAAEMQRNELAESQSKLRILEGILEEMQSKVSKFETENEGLAEANLKLTQELAVYETKMNGIQTTLSAVLAEKEETFGQLQLSRETVEDLQQKLASEDKKLQSQISSVREENNTLNEMYQEARKELEAVIIQMDEKLNEQMAKEASLNANLESLEAELAAKSVMQARIEELEQNLLVADTRFKEEIGNIQLAAAEKEAGLSSRLEETASRLQEKEVLCEQLAQVQGDLHLAQATIEKQKEADSKKELEREAAIKQSLVEVETRHQHGILVEKQVEDLQQKLQIAEAQYKEKDIEDGEKLALLNVEVDDLKNKMSQTAELERKILELENKLQLANAKSEEQLKLGISEAETKDGTEVKSRDIGLGSATPSKRKSKKRSEGLQHRSAEATPTPPTTTLGEPSLATSFKFVLGVALVSVIIGIVLGKRY